MEAAGLVFRVVTAGGLIALGGLMVLFNRRFSIGSLQFRQSVWKMNYTDFDVRMGRIYGVVIGAALLVGGLLAAAELVV